MPQDNAITGTELLYGGHRVWQTLVVAHQNEARHTGKL